MVKILLVNPTSLHTQKSAKPTLYLPLGILYVAGVLENAGHKVEVYDAKASCQINVLFYGTGLKLQGIPHILKARDILKDDKDVKFKLIGPFEGADQEWVPYDELADEINRADIVLGLFGTTRRTNAYIANKCFQAIACEKPPITADTPAMRERFEDGKNCLLVESGNPQKIVDAINFMKDEKARRSLGTMGMLLYLERFTPPMIGEALRKNIAERFNDEPRI